MSKQHKQTALEALRGNWKTAMLTGFVASLFGATTMYTGGGGGNSSSSNDSELGNQIIDYFSSPAGEKILAITLAIIGVFVIFTIVSIFLSGAMRLGYAKFNLNLIDHKPAEFHDLFTYMNCKWKGFCMNFLTGLYIGLWTLLLVIPGIVKSFSYAMTPFILSENPEMSANDAISASKEMMDGHKWDLFCLYFSFIGWNLLVSAPALVAVGYTIFSFIEGATGAALGGLGIAILLGILGGIPLIPYMEAANAAFYRDIAPKQEAPAAEWYLSE